MTVTSNPDVTQGICLLIYDSTQTCIADVCMYTYHICYTYHTPVHVHVHIPDTKPHPYPELKCPTAASGATPDRYLGVGAVVGLPGAADSGDCLPMRTRVIHPRHRSCGARGRCPTGGAAQGWAVHRGAGTCTHSQLRQDRDPYTGPLQGTRITPSTPERFHTSAESTSK
jgi:hypothetical protein